MPTRRTLLKRAALITAAQALPVSCFKPEGANSAVRIAICGLHGRGKAHLDDMLKIDGVRIVALCDVDTRELNKHAPTVEKASGKARIYHDYRKLCEDKDVDGIMIATPNHTHTLIALTAMQHGKHVYVEKPVSHNLREGRTLVEAAAKLPKLIVTHGMQRRSDLGWAEALAWLNEGHLGKVTLSRGLNYKTRESIGKVAGPERVPKFIDHNLWCGPRPVAPVMRERYHYDWHWQWAYGNGDIGNQGPHQLDVARWALGQMTQPVRAMSLGARWGYVDDGQTPNNQLAVFRYAEGPPLLFDNRGLPAKDMDWRLEPAYRDIRIGNVIHCEGGYLAESKAFDKDRRMVKKFRLDDGGVHQKNWVEAMRSGKLVSENQSLLQGHLSASLSHLANLSWHLGRKLGTNEVRERLQGDSEALATLEDFEQNLRANRIDPVIEQPVVGPWLSFDPSTERFTGEFADEANKLIEEEYREEFKLPVIA
ncbi:MAG: Gfo/Idh/MocA family protein [Roseimicrobium sp.]